MGDVFVKLNGPEAVLQAPKLKCAVLRGKGNGWIGSA